MISLDDPVWKKLKGGYGLPYDASVDLKRLENGEDVWGRLWEELHHQGDVGEASYAAVPQLVHIMKVRKRDWNLYSLVSTIEIERHRKSNPKLPEWLASHYSDAWPQLLDLGLQDLRNYGDELTVRSILGAIALSKNMVKLGAMISYIDESEMAVVLDRYDGWSELYEQGLYISSDI